MEPKQKVEDLSKKSDLWLACEIEQSKAAVREATVSTMWGPIAVGMAIANEIQRRADDTP